MQLVELRTWHCVCFYLPCYNRDQPLRAQKSLKPFHFFVFARRGTPSDADILASITPDKEIILPNKIEHCDPRHPVQVVPAGAGFICGIGRVLCCDTMSAEGVGALAE